MSLVGRSRRELDTMHEKRWQDTFGFLALRGLFSRDDTHLAANLLRICMEWEMNVHW